MPPAGEEPITWFCEGAGKASAQDFGVDPRDPIPTTHIIARNQAGQEMRFTRGERVMAFRGEDGTVLYLHDDV